MKRKGYQICKYPILIYYFFYDLFLSLSIPILKSSLLILDVILCLIFCSVFPLLAYCFKLLFDMGISILPRIPFL